MKQFVDAGTEEMRFSPAVVTIGRTVSFYGATAYSLIPKRPEGGDGARPLIDVAGQPRACLENLYYALTAAGGEVTDLVKKRNPRTRRHDRHRYSSWSGVGNGRAKIPHRRLRGHRRDRVHRESLEHCHRRAIELRGSRVSAYCNRTTTLSLTVRLWK